MRQPPHVSDPRDSLPRELAFCAQRVRRRYLALAAWIANRPSCGPQTKGCARIMAVMPREKWTDDRLDDFKEKVDDGYAHLETKIDDGFARIDKDFRELKGEMNGRFEKVDERFEKVDERFEKVDARFDKVDARFDKVEGKFDKVEGKFDKVEGKMERGMKELRVEMNLRFQGLDARFDSLQRSLFAAAIVIVAAFLGMIGTNAF